MDCLPLVPASCALGAVGDAVGATAGVALGNTFAEAMREGSGWVIQTTIGWWIEVPALDLEDSPASTIRRYVLWLAVAVATAQVSWQGVLLALRRRADPLLDIGRGLFLVLLWSSLGIVGPATALRAGDAFSSWVLSEAAHGQAADRLVALAGMGSVDSAGAVIVLGLVMMLAGLVQATLMIFREGALVVLAGVVVFAAAGSFSAATRPWLPRITSWMLALIAYKPVAALVYASALALVGEGDDPRTVVVGLTMILLAIVALPTLMKFFTWATGTTTGGGGGAAALAAAAGAIHATTMFAGSSPGPASTQAQHIRADLGQPAPAPSPPGASTAPAAAGAAGMSTSAATPAASTGAAGAMAGVAVMGAAAAVTAGSATSRAAVRSLTDANEEHA